MLKNATISLHFCSRWNSFSHQPACGPRDKVCAANASSNGKMAQQSSLVTLPTRVKPVSPVTGFRPHGHCGWVSCLGQRDPKDSSPGILGRFVVVKRSENITFLFVLHGSKRAWCQTPFCHTRSTLTLLYTTLYIRYIMVGLGKNNE